jgi:hypothetical protein
LRGHIKKKKNAPLSGPNTRIRVKPGLDFKIYRCVISKRYVLKKKKKEKRRVFVVHLQPWYVFQPI